MKFNLYSCSDSDIRTSTAIQTHSTVNYTHIPTIKMYYTLVGRVVNKTSFFIHYSQEKKSLVISHLLITGIIKLYSYLWLCEAILYFPG